jgi:hypothetical protein
MSDHVGVLELSRVCAAMRERSLELFTQLGRWVPSASPGELQRLFAESCHRHAWHAELWEARAPAIGENQPVSTPSSGAEPVDRDDDDTRRERYRAELSALEHDLRLLHARIDPVLDPSTARTIDLVGRDVVEIAGRLDALRTR